MIRLKGNSNFSFYIYLFFFIFAPPLIPKINFILIVFLFSLFKLMTNYRGHVIETLKKSKIKLFLQLIMVAYLYIFIIMLIGMLLDPVNTSNYIVTFYRFFLVTPVTVVCITYIILRCRDLNYGFPDLIRGLIIAASIQAIIAILMALIPAVKEILVSIIYYNTGENTAQNLWHFERRYFAFSQNVLDTFGYGTGILSVLPIFYGIYRKKYAYFLLTPILLIVPFLNSRTGLLIAFIGFICILPHAIFLSGIKEKLKLIGVLSALIVVSTTVFNYLSKTLPATISWVNNGFEDMYDFLTGQGTGLESVSKLANTMWFFPESFFLLFGTGHTVYQAVGYYHSDIGLINDLWLGGLIGLFLLYLPFIFIFLKTFSNRDSSLNKVLTVFLMISFFTTDLKAVIVSYNVGTSIVMLLCFYLIYTENYEGNNNLKK